MIMFGVFLMMLIDGYFHTHLQDVSDSIVINIFSKAAINKLPFTLLFIESKWSNSNLIDLDGTYRCIPALSFIGGMWFD